MPSEPTPAQQPDGGAEERPVDDYYRLRLIHNGLILLLAARPDVASDIRSVVNSIRAEIARNRCRPAGNKHADDCDGMHSILPASPEHPLTIRYTNHRGETSLRNIIPQRLTFEEWLSNSGFASAQYAEDFGITAAQDAFAARQPEIDAMRERERKLREEVLAAIPTTWLDPILTGPAAAFDGNAPATTNVEAVLRAVKSRLAELLAAKEGGDA